jgi:hypothetical protein
MAEIGSIRLEASCSETLPSLRGDVPPESAWRSPRLSRPPRRPVCRGFGTNTTESALSDRTPCEWRSSPSSPVCQSGPESPRFPPPERGFSLEPPRPFPFLLIARSARKACDLTCNLGSAPLRGAFRAVLFRLALHRRAGRVLYLEPAS